MTKNSASVRINTKQEAEIQRIAKKLGVNRSELFRNIVQWGISMNMTIPRQNMPYKFEETASTEKSSYHFGAKMPYEVILKIKQLCLENGVSESHMYRYFIDSYLDVQSHNVIKNNTLKESKFINTNTTPQINFYNQSLTNSPFNTDNASIVGRLQKANSNNIKMAYNLGNLVGLAIILFDIFRKK